jgi:hypothetical protein
MYFTIEKYTVQFFFKRIIRSGLLREYLFFNVISLFLISGLLIPFIYFLIYINEVYLKVFHREIDVNGLNAIVSNFQLAYLFLIFITVKTDLSFFYPLFRLPVNKKNLVKIFLLKRIYFNKFSILLYAIIIIIALTNNLFTDSTGIAKLKWMAANFIISAITGLAAFYSKRSFLTGISVASVLTIILIASILSLFITSHLFISLLR